jgi:hypothetical protein
MSPVRSVTSAAAPFKPSAPAVTAPITSAVASTVPAAIPPVGAAIRPSAASAESSAVSSAITATVTSAASAALWPLETRTWIRADARKVLARCAGIPWSTRFARKQDNVLFHNSFNGSATRSRGRQRFRSNVLDGLVVRHIRTFGFAQLRVLFGLRFSGAFFVVFRSARFGNEPLFVSFRL